MKTLAAGLSLLLSALLLPNFTAAISCDPAPEVPWVRVNYTLWAEKGHDRAHFSAHREVIVPFNASYLHVMQLAALADKRFEFVSIKNFSKHNVYITTINGLQENKTAMVYWMIYKLPGPPDPTVKPENKFLIPKTVEHFYVEDGDNILFWLHYFNWKLEWKL